MTNLILPEDRDNKQGNPYFTGFGSNYNFKPYSDIELKELRTKLRWLPCDDFEYYCQHSLDVYNMELAITSELYDRKTGYFRAKLCLSKRD